MVFIGIFIYLLRDEVCQETEAGHTAEAAQLPEGVVAGQPVVPPPLDVERHQVHAEALVLGLEQMVGDLLREDVVEPLPGLGGEPHQEHVQVARGVD